MNSKYVRPPSSASEFDPSSTSAPTPNPMPSRYRNGCTNEPSTLERQTARYDRSCASQTRTGAGVVNVRDMRASSVDERAAGETEEHVFERAPPHQCRLGLGAAVVDLVQRRLAVVG